MPRACAACGQSLFKRDFSANQWFKGEGTSRCKACVKRRATALSPARVRQLAQSAHLVEISHNKASKVISFEKDGVRFNVYYTTGTVGTCLAHPAQGKTQLFRRNQDAKGVAEIFRNPRVHTGEFRGLPPSETPHSSTRDKLPARAPDALHIPSAPFPAPPSQEACPTQPQGVVSAPAVESPGPSTSPRRGARGSDRAGPRVRGPARAPRPPGLRCLLAGVPPPPSLQGLRARGSLVRMRRMRPGTSWQVGRPKCREKG